MYSSLLPLVQGANRGGIPLQASLKNNKQKKFIPVPVWKNRWEIATVTLIILFSFNIVHAQTYPDNILSRAEDSCGRESVVMIAKELRDHFFPTIKRGDKKTFNCSAFAGPKSQFTLPVVSDICKLKGLPAFEDSGTFKCGLGTVTRQPAVGDPRGNWSPTQQCITLDHVSDVMAQIPSEINRACADHPGKCTDPRPSAGFPLWPEITNVDCQEIDISFKNKDYFDQSNTCFRKIRVWKINNKGLNPRAVPRVCDDTGLGGGKYKDGSNGCGNSEQCTTTLIVNDKLKSDIVCVESLSPVLMPVDKDGDGNVDGGLATVWARELIVSYQDICPTGCDLEDENTTSFLLDRHIDDDADAPYGNNPPNSPPAAAMPGLDFDCSDLREILVAVWARDDFGNWNFCTAKLHMQNSMGVCPELQLLQISGHIETEAEQMVDLVTVNITDGADLQLKTGQDGYFRGFAAPGLPYTVVPRKDVDYLFGVSTRDIVTISRHILGQKELKSPYKMIAADVDRSGYISGNDLVHIRQLILNQIDQFPNNDSWRFIDGNYIFPDKYNPWSAPFPEVVSIKLLQEDLQVDFIGIKVGDVTDDAVINDLTTVQPRLAQPPLVFEVEDVRLSRGEHYTINFRAGNIHAYSGYQFTLNFNPDIMDIVNVQPGSLRGLGNENFGLGQLEEGVITTSWNGTAQQTPEKDLILFSVSIRAVSDLVLSEEMELGSSHLTAEAYTKGLDIATVRLKFPGNSSDEPEFKLYQNRPNPFENSTVIGFSVPWTTEVILSLYNISGQLLKRLEGEFPRGYSEVRIDRSDLPSKGIYHYQLATPVHTEVKKMIFLR